MNTNIHKSKSTSQSPSNISTSLPFNPVQPFISTSTIVSRKMSTQLPLPSTSLPFDPAQASVNTSIIISAEMIHPFPKAGPSKDNPRKISQKRRSKILTNTPKK